MYCEDKFERDGTPKYFCVRRINEKKVEEITHEKYRPNFYSGKLTLTLQTEQDFLIGSGEVEIRNNRQYLSFARIHNSNKIVIPGSSLKGATRTYVEALSPSCISTEQNACKKDDKPCPACAIFGKQDYQGRVFFKDAELINGKLNNNKEIVQRRPPRISCLGRRFYYFAEPQKVLGRQKELIEVVEKGAKFKFEIEFTNLYGWELGLLLLSMGTDTENTKDFSLKIGGAKNRKCGKVKIIPDAIHFFNKREWLKSKIKIEEKRVESKSEKTKKELIDAYWDKCENWGIKEQVKSVIEKFKKGAPDERE